MTIELDKQVRTTAIASIQRYFDQNMEEPIGNVAAGGLLAFFVEEIGPAIYNQAVADVQERLQVRGRVRLLAQVRPGRQGASKLGARHPRRARHHNTQTANAGMPNNATWIGSSSARV